MSKICMENGALNIKLGFMTAENPYLVLQSKGIKMPIKNLMDINQKYFVGPYSDFLGQDHLIESPIKNGMIMNWELMEAIWDEVFLDFSLLSEKENREVQIGQDNDLNFLSSINYTKKCYGKIMEYLFEKYNIGKIAFSIDSVNSLYSTGRTTGLVVDSGHSFTKILPIINGYIDPQSIWQMNWSGHNVTELITRKIRNNLNEFIVDQTNIDYIKSNCLYHAIDKEKEEDKIELANLPDGTTVELGHERFRFVENMFIKYGQDDLTLVEGAWTQVQKHDFILRKKLMNQIFLTGGNTGIRNFQDKFLFELNKIIPKGIQMNILTNRDRILAAFNGSYKKSENSYFYKQYITQQDFKEYGENIILQKGTHLLI